MAKRDYYEVLGVPRSATAEQIRSAYRKLARKYHPDVNKESGAEDQFKEIQEAYDDLSDKPRRQAYDQFGFAGTRGAPAGGPGGHTYTWTGGPGDFDLGEMGDLGDLFEVFTGRGRRRGGGRAGRPAAPPGEDLLHEVELSFEEAALGTARDVAIQGPGGRQRLSVKIPPGVGDGSRIRLRGRGRPSPLGGPGGDLYIVTRIRPHRFFSREGNDVIVQVPLTLAEAVRGTRLEVPTLTGRATVTIPPGTSGGGRLRLKGLGIADPRGGARGDQYVVTRIVLPPSLDADSRRLIEEFDRRNPTDPRKDLGW